MGNPNCIDLKVDIEDKPLERGGDLHHMKTAWVRDELHDWRYGQMDSSLVDTWIDKTFLNFRNL